jgi:hypothetical protein
MPNGPKGEKRPADAIGNAIMIGKIAVVSHLADWNLRGATCEILSACEASVSPASDAGGACAEIGSGPDWTMPSSLTNS